MTFDEFKFLENIAAKTEQFDMAADTIMRVIHRETGLKTFTFKLYSEADFFDVEYSFYAKDGLVKSWLSESVDLPPEEVVKRFMREKGYSVQKKVFQPKLIDGNVKEKSRWEKFCNFWGNIWRW